MDLSGSGKVVVTGFYQYLMLEYYTGKTRRFFRYMEWIARWRFHSNYCTEIKHRADCNLHDCRCSRAAYAYTGCPRRNVPDFRRVFLRSNYTDITQNTYIQSSMVTEILAREKCGLLWCLRTILCP